MMHCPICRATAVQQIDIRRDVPILMNRLYDSREAARAAVRGTVDLAGCGRCGFAWNRAFDPALIRYDSSYENDQAYSAVFRSHIEQRAREIIDSVPVADPIDFLEIGVGQGRFAGLIADLAGARLRSAAGYDPAWRGDDQAMLGKLRIHKLYFNSESARRLEQPPNVVVSRHTIEHIPDPLQFLRLVREALGPRSRALLFLETPCIAWILEHRAMQDIFYEHCSIFTRQSLGHALSVAGFEVHDIRHVFGGQYLWAVARAAPGPVVSPEPSGVPFEGFAGIAADFTRGWRTICENARARGRSAIWGAGAKGVTFAQLIDPDGRLFDHAVDISPAKQGRHLPGSGLKVLAPADSAARGVSTIFVMNPNYLGEIRATTAGLGMAAELIAVE